MATVDTTLTDNNSTVTATEATTTVKDVSESTMNNGCDKKEEEPLTTPVPTTTQKDEAENANSKSNDKTEEELLKAGTKLITEEKYSEACDILSSAMQLIQQKDIVNTIDAVQYYMTYGEALLRLVQSSNDLFAAPVRESQQQHLADMEEEDDDVDLAEPQLVTDATEKSEESKESKESQNGGTATENSGNSKEEQDEDDDVDLKQSQALISNSKEEADDEPEQPAAAEPAQAPQGDVDTSDDREYAWESFEFARSIIEEYLDKEENKNKDNDKYLAILASAHAFLGELLIEDERNDDALIEFNKALELQNKCKPEMIKCRARASNHFMACLAAQFADKDDEAVKHCDAALKGLSERISGLLTQFKCELKENENDTDYQQTIKLAEDFMADTQKFNDESKNSEDGKELKDLVGIMGDLCAKLEEVKEIIQLKKDGKYGNAQDNAAPAPSGFDAQLMMDPLQALISGLTSKFGIDEEELAALAAEEEQGDDENKNTSNKNISQAPNGITTIGFGNVASMNDDEEVNDLDLCVKRKSDKTDNDKKEEKKTTQVSGKKRKMEDADIDDGMDEVNGAAKKMKLNSGDAASVTPAVANNEDGN